MNIHKLTAKHRIHLLLASLVIPMLSYAQSESQSDVAEDTPANATVPANSGRKAFIDPETGELTSQPPSGQAIEQGQQVFQQSTEGLVEEVRPDGSASVNLQGRFRMPLRVRKNCDGSFTTWHGDENQTAVQTSQEAQDCGE